MDNQTNINTITAYLSSVQPTLDAMNAAKTVLENGYQSDAAAITSGIAAGIEAAMEPITAKITAALAALQDQSAPDDTTRVQNALTVLNN